MGRQDGAEGRKKGSDDKYVAQYKQLEKLSKTHSIDWTDVLQKEDKYIMEILPKSGRGAGFRLVSVVLFPELDEDCTNSLLNTGAVNFICLQSDRYKNIESKMPSKVKETQINLLINSLPETGLVRRHK